LLSYLLSQPTSLLYTLSAFSYYSINLFALSLQYTVCALSLISILHNLYPFMSSSLNFYPHSSSSTKFLYFLCCPFIPFHLHQGLTRRCRLSWQTHSALPKCGGNGRVAGSQPMSTAVHRSPSKLLRSNSIFIQCSPLCTYSQHFLFPNCSFSLYSPMPTLYSLPLFYSFIFYVPETHIMYITHCC
jgi:hypothetical protein